MQVITCRKIELNVFDFIFSDKYLICSKNTEVNSVFLPLGNESDDYNLNITATVKNGSFVVSMTITTQVSHQHYAIIAY